jgi:PH (Pleckstrin Homology) domain-containing protein/putative oligomerization/nucleic acid binding protein
MPFGFHKKGEEEQRPIVTNVTDKEELEEIKKISNMLNANEEVFVVARQSRLKPGGSKFTPNIVYATDRRIIMRDPSMLGLREEVVDIPYDLISSVRLDKGVFSSSVIFTAPGLRSSGRLGLIEKMAGAEFGANEAMITAIPKDKAEDLVEVIRNGMDRQREVYQQQQPQQPHAGVDATTDSNNTTAMSIADELAKLAKLKEQGVISEAEFQQMKQDLIKKM